MDSQRECTSITSTDAGVGEDSQLGCLTAGQVGNIVDIPGNVEELRSTDLTSQLSEMAGWAQPDVFIVDKILRYRQVRRRKYVLIKWKGWRKASWEPVENVFNLPKAAAKSTAKEIISLVGRRRMKGNIEYRAHFRGYDAKHDLWMKESLVNKKRPDLVAEYKEKYGADVEAFSHLKRASYRKGRKRPCDDNMQPPAHLALSPVLTDDQCLQPALTWLDIGMAFRIPAFAPSPSLPRTDQSAHHLIRTSPHLPLEYQNNAQQAANVLPEVTWLSFPPLACLSLLRRPLSHSAAVPPSVVPPVLPTNSVTEEITAAAAASCSQVQGSGLDTVREEDPSIVQSQPFLSPSEAEEHFAIFANHHIEPDSTTDRPQQPALSCGDIQTEEITVLTSSGETRDGVLSLTCSQSPASHLPHDTNSPSPGVEDVSPTCRRVSVIVKAPARITEDDVYASTNNSTKSVGRATESSAPALSAVFAQQCQQQVKVMEKKPVNSWTVGDLESYLYMRGYERVALTVRKLHIDGQRLLSMLEQATNVRQHLGLLYADGSRFLCLIRQLQSLRDDTFMSNTDLEPV